MKQNYRLVMLETLKHLEGRPKLLLHACCGPCSSNVIKELCQYFDITICYTNSNIYPADEYHRRESELERFVKEFNDKENQNVQVVEDTYDPEEYLTHIALYKDTGEKGYRCYVCYKVRMEKARDYARMHGFDYWTTVLSVSPHKNSQWINEIGDDLDLETPKFLHSDFKKDNGYLKSTRMSDEYHMYRQNYCGCVYSYQEMLEREKTDL